MISRMTLHHEVSSIARVLTVDLLSKCTTPSFLKDFMRRLVAEALSRAMIQFFHGGCKRFLGNISKI